MKNASTVGEGCEIKQKGAIDVQIKKEPPSVNGSSNNLSGVFALWRMR